MFYLAWQTLFWLILAAILGFIIAWWLRGSSFRSRISELEGEIGRQRSQLSSKDADMDGLKSQLSDSDSEKARLSDELAKLKSESGNRAAQLTSLQAEFDREKGRSSDWPAKIADLEGKLSSSQRDCEECNAEVRRLRGRISELESKVAVQVSSQAAAAPQTFVGTQATGPDEVLTGTRPVGLSGPQGVADDLKKISGVGRKLEKVLHELGIYHFRQIAAFNPDNVAWVDDYLQFKGRIDRENWIKQAKVLADGGDTEFSNRYKRGETTSNQ